MLNIVVTASDKNEAAGIANAIAFSLQEEVKNLLKVDNVSVILKAGTSFSSLEENNRLGLLLPLAAVAGLVPGIALSLVFELVAAIGRFSQHGKKKNTQLQTVFK